MDYVDCLYHLHCWNTETDVNPNYSILKIPAIAVQELVNHANGTNFCGGAHFHSNPVVRSLGAKKISPKILGDGLSHSMHLTKNLRNKGKCH